MTAVAMASAPVTFKNESNWPANEYVAPSSTTAEDRTATAVRSRRCHTASIAATNAAGGAAVMMAARNAAPRASA